MKKVLISFSVFAALTSLASADVIDRGLLAERRCTPSKVARATYNPASASMQPHYEPSNLQRALTPVYSAIFDDFGGIIQSLISNKDEYQVAYTLRRLGRIVEEANADLPTKVCMATCMVNHLMEPDDEIIPMTSMTLAVAKGRGFCRHYSMATLEVLKAAKIKAKTEVALDHMFLKLSMNGKPYYTDPANQDGMSDCNFMPVK